MRHDIVLEGAFLPRDGEDKGLFGGAGQLFKFRHAKDGEGDVIERNAAI